MEIKYSSDFLNLYDTILNDTKKDKKQTEKKVNDIRYSEMLLFIISFISFFAFFIAPIENLNSKLMFFAIGMVMIVISILYMILNEIKIFGLRVNLKNIMMKDFAKTISNDWEFKEKDSISEVYYKKSGFNPTYKSIYSDGYLKAKRKDKTIDMGNVSVMRDITNSNRNITVEAFNGIFAHSPIDANMFEVDLMKTNSKNNVKQKLEIVNGKLYMYSDNIKEATTVFDAAIIQKIMDLRNELGIDIELMVYEDEIYFRFYTPNTISANLFGSDYEKQALYFYYKISKFIVEFSNEIEKKVQ